MSYINDALRKVQREKGSDYASCSDMIFDGEKRPQARQSRFPLIIGVTAVVCIAVIGIAAWWWQDVNRESRRRVAVVQVPPVPAVPSSPAEVAEMTPSGVTTEASAVPGGASADVAAKSPVEVQPAPAANDRPTAEAKKEEQDAGIGAKKKEAVSPAPANPKVLYERALKSHREGRLKEAEALYQEVVKTDPRHVSALNNLGVIWMNRKMYKQAVGSFQKALNVRHDYVDAHYNLACLYARKNDKKQSLNYLKNAIDLNPEVRQWAVQDHDFKILATLPEFNQLVGTEGN